VNVYADRYPVALRDIRAGEIVLRRDVDTCFGSDDVDLRRPIGRATTNAKKGQRVLIKIKAKGEE